MDALLCMDNPSHGALIKKLQKETVCAVWVGLALRDAVGVWLLRRNVLGFWCGLGMAWFIFCCQILLQKSLHLTPLLHRSIVSCSRETSTFAQLISREISACHDFSRHIYSIQFSPFHNSSLEISVFHGFVHKLYFS